MANENGIIFIKASVTPHIGISVADCQAVFGTARNTFGDVITNEAINKWAKYKPIKRSGLSFPDQINADFTWKSTADWWKGTDGQCGLTFTTYSGLGSSSIATAGFLHDLLAGGLSWGYVRPTGGINAFPFRRRDFNYYDHNAPKPVSGVYDNLQLYGGGKLTVQIEENRAANGYGLSLSDLTIGNSSVNGWYVGVLIWLDSSHYTFAFSADTIGNGGSHNIEFTGMTGYGGHNVTIVPFLSSVSWAQGQDLGGGTFLSCDVAPQTYAIRAEADPIATNVSAYWETSFHVRVSYAVTIDNNTGAQITINNLRISLYEDNVEVAYKPNRDITIAVGGQWAESSVLLFNYAYDSNKNYTVRVTATSHSIDKSVPVDDPRT